MTADHDAEPMDLVASRRFSSIGRQMPHRTRTVRSLAGLRRATARFRETGATLALVPTMGALHAGHLSLVRLARRRADRVIVSIFVNPAQFAPHEDFATYPRTFAADLAALAALAVDLVWAPTVDVMYPDDFATRIVPAGPAVAGLEDAFRPHFFGGVATVVAKLFLQCLPDIAVFGEKDYQQLKVVTQMAKDLAIPLRVVPGKTVREKDGLALSSRNAYLSAERARSCADALSRAQRLRRPHPRGQADRVDPGAGTRRNRARRIRGRLSRGAPCRHAGADPRAAGRADPPARRREDRNDAADRQRGGVSRFFRRGRACPGHPDKGTAVPLESRSPEQAR